MTVRPKWLRIGAFVLALAFVVGLLGLPGTRDAAWAQNPPPHKKNFAQRHPTLTSAAAGYAAYKIAKKTGQNRARAGRKKNFAQRHPFLTGMAAAGATHHIIKKSNQHHP
jgi:hypothetical protein